MVDTAPVRRRTRKAGRQKPEILDAAVRVITERGMDGTRFADVSEATGVPIASLQYYFGSREDLLIAAFRHDSNTKEAQIRVGLEPISDPTERILYMIDAHLDMYDPASERSVLLSEEFYRVALRDPELQLDMLDEYRGWRGMIADAIRTGVDAGQFVSETDPDLAALCLYAFMEGIAQPTAMGDPALPREVARQLICEYMKALLPSPLPSPSPSPSRSRSRSRSPRTPARARRSRS
jgi:AcrR family transcriptional regulator